MPDDPLDELYATPPDEFLARRLELAERTGDRQLQKVRKPTVAAWIVNAFVLAEPACVDELNELGEQLRAAQHALDPDRLRELSTERRKLVARLTDNALRRADRMQASATLRDEVSGTFDAALADPDVAARLGRLQKAERWSGFGFGPGGTPELTLVRGGKDRKDKPARPSASERREQRRALGKAQDEFDAADAAFEQAQQAERELTARVRTLTAKLARIQADLDDARTALDEARGELTETRTRRREARSALDRAERSRS